MPPAVIPVLSKSQARNARRKRARLLNSAQNLIQKNHIARVEQQLSDSIKASKKVQALQGELELATSDNSRLQNIAQSARQVTRRVLLSLGLGITICQEVK